MLVKVMLLPARAELIFYVYFWWQLRAMAESEYVTTARKITESISWMTARPHNELKRKKYPITNVFGWLNVIQWMIRELSDQIIVRSDQIKDHYFGDLELILDQLFREWSWSDLRSFLRMIWSDMIWNFQIMILES